MACYKPAAVQHAFVLVAAEHTPCHWQPPSSNISDSVKVATSRPLPEPPVQNTVKWHALSTMINYPCALSYAQPHGCNTLKMLLLTRHTIYLCVLRMMLADACASFFDCTIVLEVVVDQLAVLVPTRPPANVIRILAPTSLSRSS